MVRGRPGDRAELPRERDDEHSILGPQIGEQPPRRLLHEVDAPRHALTAVDEQQVGGGQHVGAHHVEALGLAVLREREAFGVERGDPRAFGVLDRRLEQHARDLAHLGDLERIEHDAIGRLTIAVVGRR